MATIQTCQDQELIDAYLRDGAEEAFAEIVRRHGPWVFAGAYRQLGDRQLAEDATQVVFVLLAQKAKQMRSETKLSGWLFNTMQFTVKNFRRMDKRRKQHEEHAARERETISIEPPENKMAAQLDAALGRLPVKDRSAVLLRFYQDRPFAEVGVAMGVSEDAVRKRVERAVGTLRKSLGAKGAEGISALTMYGMHHYSPAIGEQIVKGAIAAKAGAVLPAQISAAVKGTGSLMTMAKVKTAAMVAAGIAVIAAPVSIIAVQNITRAAPPNADAAAKAPDNSPATAEAKNVYSLTKEEAVRYLPPPFVVGRETFLAEAQRPPQGRGGAGAIGDGGFAGGGGGFGGGGGAGGGGGFGDAADARPAAPVAAIVMWDENLPARVTAGLGGRRNSYTVQTSLQNIAARSGEEVIGDPKLLNLIMPGDFVVRRATMQDDLLASMQKIISEQMQRPCTIKMVQTPSDVYVLSGDWKFAPIDTNDESQTLHIYDKDMSDERGQGNGMASPKAFAIVGLSKFIHASVMIEGKGLPGMIRFKTHYNRTPVDPAKVLDHVAQQTGLTWKLEKRNTPKIDVETVKPGESK